MSSSPGCNTSRCFPRGHHAGVSEGCCLSNGGLQLRFLSCLPQCPPKFLCKAPTLSQAHGLLVELVHWNVVVTFSCYVELWTTQIVLACAGVYRPEGHMSMGRSSFFIQETWTSKRVGRLFSVRTCVFYLFKYLNRFAACIQFKTFLASPYASRKLWFSLLLFFPLEDMLHIQLRNVFSMKHTACVSLSLQHALYKT